MAPVRLNSRHARPQEVPWPLALLEACRPDRRRHETDAQLHKQVQPRAAPSLRQARPRVQAWGSGAAGALGPWAAGQNATGPRPPAGHRVLAGAEPTPRSPLPGELRPAVQSAAMQAQLAAASTPNIHQHNTLCRRFCSGPGSGKAGLLPSLPGLGHHGLAAASSAGFASPAAAEAAAEAGVASGGEGWCRSMRGFDFGGAGGLSREQQLA